MKRNRPFKIRSADVERLSASNVPLVFERQRQRPIIPRPKDAWIPVLPVRHPSRRNGHGLVTLEVLESDGFISADPTFPKATVVCEQDHRIIALSKSLNLPVDDRRRHMLIEAKTGGGKTSKLISPMLLSDLKNGINAVVIDPKNELSGQVREFVDRVCPEAELLCLNFTRPDISVGWSPFPAAMTLDIALEVCEALYPALGRHETSHFRSQAVRITAAIAVALSERHSGPITLPMVASIFNAGHEAIADLAKETGNAELKQFAQQGGQANADTSFDSINNSLSPFLRADIGAVTSHGELDFDRLAGDRQLVLILQFPEGVRATKDIQSLFVTSLLNWVMERASREETGRLPRGLSLFLDEFATIGHLPIERAIHTLRSRDVSVTGVIQSRAQLEAVYGSEEARSIQAGFNTHVALSPIDLTDAEVISRMSGEMVSEEILTEPGSNIVVGRRAAVRRVLSALDIAVPGSHPEYGALTTWVCRDSKVFQAALPAIWQYPGFEKWDRNKGGEMPSAIWPKREQPLTFDLPPVRVASSAVSNIKGMSENEVRERLAEVKQQLACTKASPAAQKWWSAFEQENISNMRLPLRLAEELLSRTAKLDEYFQAYTDCDSDNIQASLHFFDYWRLKKEADGKRRAAMAAYIKSNVRKDPAFDSAPFDPFSDD